MDSFKAGQLVVCVDDSPRKGLQATVTKGRIYTIAEVFLGRRDGLPGLILEGVKAPGTYRGFEPGRFRPCRPTDIGILRQAVADLPCPAALQDA
jgi:hypothetical protein